MASNEMKYDLHISDVTRRLTLVVNLRGYPVWLFRKRLAMVYLWIASKLLGVKIEREG